MSRFGDVTFVYPIRVSSGSTSNVYLEHTLTIISLADPCPCAYSTLLNDCGEIEAELLSLEKRKEREGGGKRGKENFPQIPRKFLYVDSEQILHRNVPMSTALNHQKFLNAKNCVGGARENNSIFSFFSFLCLKLARFCPKKQKKYKNTFFIFYLLQICLHTYLT